MTPPDKTNQSGKEYLEECVSRFTAVELREPDLFLNYVRNCETKDPLLRFCKKWKEIVENEMNRRQWLRYQMQSTVATAMTSVASRNTSVKPGTVPSQLLGTNNQEEDSDTHRFVSREELGLPPRKPEPDEEQMVEFITGEHYLPNHNCIGVQITHPDVPHASPERCAVILGDNPEGKETRKTFVAKLRLLADAIEEGKGGVFGDQVLSGRELNYEQMKPVLERREQQDVHDGDYLPAGYREWSIQALRALDKINKSRPTCLK